MSANTCKRRTNGLYEAVKDGRISKERLDESVKRILLYEDEQNFLGDLFLFL